MHLSNIPKKLSNYLRYKYLNLYEKIDKTSYNDRWGVEDLEKRLKLKEIVPVKLIKKDYSESIYETNEYEVSNSWFRSHGNNFSTRFSSIDIINLKNVNKMKLAWVYEPNKDGNYIPNVQANPIYFDGLIYTPNSQNQIVSINPNDGK